MSDYKNNPIFKQILAEISSKTVTGRTDLNWKSLNEAKIKKLKKEAANEPTDEPIENPDEAQPKAISDPAPKKSVAGNPATPNTPKSSPSKPAGQGSAFTASEPDAENTPEEGDGTGSDETEKAQEDALKSKAELEKAKAEKNQAEKDIEKQSYVHLTSPGGVSFLLGKLIDHAFKTNTIDSLAGEMVQKLKIQTPEEFQLFSDEMVPYKNLPGVGDLLISMKSMANSKADQTT